MSNCTGRDALLALCVSFALGALGACGSDPDAWIEVSRTGASGVVVQVCAHGNVQCGTSVPLFSLSEPASVIHTVGIYLDVAADQLDLRFTQTPQEPAPKLCQQVVLPFEGTPRVKVVLPDIAVEPQVSGCPACVPENCTP